MSESAQRQYRYWSAMFWSAKAMGIDLPSEGSGFDKWACSPAGCELMEEAHRDYASFKAGEREMRRIMGCL